MRLNFEFNDAQVENINALKKRTGAASMKELFNNAMTMLEWAVDETAQGKEIEATDGNTSRVFVTPLLRQVRLNRVVEEERTAQKLRDLLGNAAQGTVLKGTRESAWSENTVGNAMRETTLNSNNAVVRALDDATERAQGDVPREKGQVVREERGRVRDVARNDEKLDSWNAGH